MGLVVVMWFVLGLLIVGVAVALKSEMRDHRAKTRKELIAVASLLREEIRSNKTGG